MRCPLSTHSPWALSSHVPVLGHGGSQPRPGAPQAMGALRPRPGTGSQRVPATPWHSTAPCVPSRRRSSSSSSSPSSSSSSSSSRSSSRSHRGGYRRSGRYRRSRSRRYSRSRSRSRRYSGGGGSWDSRRRSRSYSPDRSYRYGSRRRSRSVPIPTSCTTPVWPRVSPRGAFCAGGSGSLSPPPPLWPNEPMCLGLASPAPARLFPVCYWECPQYLTGVRRKETNAVALPGFTPGAMGHRELPQPQPCSLLGAPVGP